MNVDTTDVVSASPACPKPITRTMVNARDAIHEHRGDADNHRRARIAQRVKSRRDQFQRRVTRQTDRITGKRQRGLMRVECEEFAVLIDDPIMLSPRIASPTEHGMVSSRIITIERESVCRNSAKFLVAALREMRGNVADAMATPKTPSGSKKKR